MQRVVVTGYGMVSPLGLDAQSSWESLIAGKSGVGPVTLFDATDFPIKVAAEVKDFDPGKTMDRRELRRQDRYQWLAQIATQEAFEHSGLEIKEEKAHRYGTVISSGIGGLKSIEEQVQTLFNEGPRWLSPFAIPSIMTNGAAGWVSIKHGLRGPSFSVGSACASASDGMGMAFQLIRTGMTDAILAGGSEAGVTEFGLATFERIGAYSQRMDGTPSPFSKHRDGLIMGEGAAILVFESLEHAKARGAHILAEVIGYGASADAHHITAPTEDGSGSANAIRAALETARISPEDISYINAHGTGTPLNDTSETKSIKRALGQQAYNIPISSSKSMTGHIMGGTAALEAVFCVQAINHHIVPPTINYQEPDEDCDLDYVPNEAREVNVRVAMSNAFGFGGHNSVMIFREFIE